MSRALAAIMLWLLVGVQSALAAPPQLEYPIRFGWPLYFPPADTDTIRAIPAFQLIPAVLATLNLRHTGDLFSPDFRFYLPDLVTSGREAALSALGMGIDWTRATWRERPWREARTGRANLALLPSSAVGNAHSSAGGVEGPLLELTSQRVSWREPLTALYHREGFYSHQPFEFLHSRSVSTRDDVMLGGLFPSSEGQFRPYSSHQGQTVWSEWQHRHLDSSVTSVSLMDGLHKVSSPNEAGVQRNHRIDFDFDHRRKALSGDLGFHLYRSESELRRSGWRERNRDYGIVASYDRDWLDSKIRLGIVDGRLPGGRVYDLQEFLGSAGASFGNRLATFRISVGAEGWLADRVRPVCQVEAWRRFEGVGRVAVTLSQSVKEYSPEQMFARYRGGRFEDPIEPILNENRDLPVMGRKLPPTFLRLGLFRLDRDIPFGTAAFTAFSWQEVHSAAWQVVSGNYLTWSPVQDRHALGGTVDVKLNWNEWRGGLSGLVVKRDLAKNDPMLPEPSVRFQWDIGWHRFFYDGYFETDFQICQRLIDRFGSYGTNTSERLGGGVPIEARFTGRISRFTFYYGVHNITRNHYRLLPGYLMTTKEEYWGVDWLLLD